MFWIGNALISPIPFIFLLNWSFFIAMIPSLMIGAAINIVVALLFVRVFQERLFRVINRGD